MNLYRRAGSWCTALLAALLVTGCSASDNTGIDGSARSDSSLDARRDGSNTIDTPAADTNTMPPTQRFMCPDCPSSAFPEPTAMACSPDAASKPTLIYPPDGVLLPPNLNVIEIQFAPGAGNTLFEVDFSNHATDVRAVTRCNPVTSVRGRMTGACGFTLSQEVWDAMVAPNRGRDPVTITVRGTTDAANCTSTAMVTRNINFSSEDIQGGIYYWQSAVYGGTAGRTGGIYLHDFGQRDPTPTPFLESGPTGRCTGCHNLSRDGERISVGQDDPDADDEFRGGRTSLRRGTDRTAVPATTSPGFQTFNHDHSRMLSSNFTYLSMTGNTQFVLSDGNTGARIRMVPLPAAGTQPDWSADDRHVVYVQPRAGSIATQGDHHFHGGDLFAMDVDAAGNFGTGHLLLAHDLMGEVSSVDSANYYPSFSPDGAFIVFNHATQGDIFYNRTAQVWLTTGDGHASYPLRNLNLGDNLTNSWPRWSPFVQPYRAGHILWVTFSSNRDYGVRVENQGQTPALHNCYPPASPTEDMPQSTDWTMCEHPQIWVSTPMNSVAVATRAGPRSGCRSRTSIRTITRRNGRRASSRASAWRWG